MKKSYDRNIFTIKMLGMDLKFLLSAWSKIIGINRNKKINKAFTEKIMTIVTAVNGCTYCTWFHAKQAVSSGISKEEVRRMLQLQFHADATDFEIPALLYAQHYAETDRNPDKEMTFKLFEYYGDKTANHIIIIIRIIFFGNLTGNTFDAFISRLNGIPAKNSNKIFEFIFFIVTAPLLLPLIPFTKKCRNPNF